MQSPKVGKSPVGHLNALVGNGLRSYAYPGKAAQLLGYRPSFATTLQRGALVEYGTVPGVNDVAFNYLERNIDLADGANIENPAKADQLHSELLPSKVARDIKHPEQQAQVTSSSRNDYSTVPQAMLPEGNSALAAKLLTTANAINRHLASTHLSNTQLPDKRFSSTDSSSVHVSSGDVFSGNVSNGILSSERSTKMSENAVASDARDNTGISHKVTGQSTRPASLPRPLQPTAKSENVDASQYAEGLSEKPSGSGINKVLVNENSLPVTVKKNNHSILHKRYQAMLDNPNLSSRFNADPKTRAAIARMQERLANDSDTGQRGMTTRREIHHEALPILTKNAQTPLSFYQPIENVAVEISKAITNNFQNFPTANIYRNIESRKQADRLEKLDSELAHQKDIISRMSAENRRYQKLVAKLESQQKNSSDNRKRDSGTSTFWAKNRLTHAMLRIQS